MEYFLIAVAVFVIGYFIVNRGKSNTSTTVTPSPVPSTRPGVSVDRNADGAVSKFELKKLTKVQLLDMAEKKNLKVKRSGTKAEVINEIHSQLK